MKLNIFILLLFLSIACGKNASDNFIIKYNDFEMVSDEFALQFIEVIEESRCPLDVQCVWPGRVVVELGLLTNMSSIPTIRLTHGVDQDESSDTTIMNHYIRLISVNPYPVALDSINFEDYEIEVLVEEL